MANDAERTRLIDVTGGQSMPAAVAHPTEGSIVGYVGVVATFPVYLREGRLAVYFPEGEAARDELVARLVATAQEVADESFGEVIPPPAAPPTRR
ncbi:MAG: hypothetical protein HY320_11255 [Armatimonadetes bacterium]|nr:hypothetical protein [Armatimonadota bacterium]